MKIYRQLLVVMVLMVSMVSWAAAADADKATADAHLQEGIEHLKAADSDPSRLVDGAIAMADALQIYRELEDYDSVTQVQASLFWARKRMNHDQINAYLERSGNTPQKRERAEKAFAVAEEVADEKVDSAQAEEYFANAEKFAKKNPDDHFMVAVRYFEVAERFAGSPVAVNAQRRSLKAQQEYMAEFNRKMEEKAEEKRSSLFTRSVPASSGSMEVPDRRDHRRAEREMKQVYGNRLRERDTERQWELAKELLNQARGTKHDVAMRYALLSQANEIAIDSGACHLIWDICHQIGDDFAKQNPAQLLEESLSSIRRSDAAEAMLALLKDPLDAEANLTAGLFFVLDAERGDTGFEMLSMGSDEQWRKLAEMELAKPRNAQEQYDLARTWDALIKGERDARRNLSIRKRAYHWYQQAVDGLTGMAKTTAERQIAVLEPTIPLLDADWGKLTEDDWERVPGMVLTVDAFRGLDNNKLSLAPGQKIRVVPHPTDEWIRWEYRTKKQVNYKGGVKYIDEPIARGALVVEVDDKLVKPGVIEGPARQIDMRMHTVYYHGEGKIRVKVIPVED